VFCFAMCVKLSRDAFVPHILGEAAPPV
jgi:hypothetical protein